VTVVVRRYLCLSCGAVVMTVPRGIAPGRHFSASAIGLALLLYGVLRVSADEVGERVGMWGRGPGAWRTVARWLTAIDAGLLLPCARIRASPAWWSPRRRAERAATTVAALCPASSLPLGDRVFIGAALGA
jgi:hypothetical protein